MIDMQINAGIAGLFRIQTAKADADGNEIPGTRVERAAWQPNLITNTGMDYIGGSGGAPASFLSYVSVGSGATEPQFTDTALQARVATVAVSGESGTTVDGFSTSSPYYTWYRRQFQFAAGAAAGVLSELGVTNAAGTTAYTRALIRDTGGNPTTITVLSDEILIVTYERRVYAYESDVTTTATIKGVERTIRMRPAGMGTSSGMNASGNPWWSDYVWGGYWYTGGSGNLGPITGIPDGTQNTPSSTQKVDEAYVPGSFYKDQTIRLGVNDLAGLTITGFRGINGALAYQIVFSPGIPKTNSETVNLRLRMAWARYTPA